MKINKYVLLLRQEQSKLQTIIKKDINTNWIGNQAFGVWIAVRCGKCGKDYNTPFNIRDNGRCHDCGKLIYRLKAQKSTTPKKAGHNIRKAK